jgi:hypothetical protein
MTKKVLILEEDPHWQDTFTYLLASINKDYLITTESSPDRAIEVLQIEKPELMIAYMYIADERQEKSLSKAKSYFGHIRELYPDMILIVYSLMSGSISERWETTKELRVDDIIYKSEFSADALIERIQMAENRKHQPDKEQKLPFISISETKPQIFVSYSHEDKAFVEMLAKDCEIRGFSVWWDEKIQSGDRWFQKISQAITNCLVVIIIMSEHAENSEWVEREILLAQRNQKPILPLLLRGQVLPLLISTQYFDVRDGKVPAESFYAHLAQVTKSR